MIMLVFPQKHTALHCQCQYCGNCIFRLMQAVGKTQQVLIYYKSKNLLIAFLSQTFPPEKKTFPH